MVGKPQIREIIDDDIEKIVSLWNAADVIRPWNNPVGDIEFARRNPHSTVLVLVHNDHIVATTMVGDDGHRGWVYYVVVDPNHQARGFGRTIMVAAEDWLRDRGVWKVNLLVRQDNPSGDGFYRHIGYQDSRCTCFKKILAKPN